MTRAWTKDAPTAPGWYWCRSSSRPLSAVMVVGDLVYASSPSRQGPFALHTYHGEWLGPITPEDVARADNALVLDGQCIDWRGESWERFKADAAVGRKLREIASKAEKLTIGVLRGAIVTVCSFGSGVKSPLGGGFDGPDALDAAYEASLDMPVWAGPDYGNMSDGMLLREALPEYPGGMSAPPLDPKLRAAIIDFLEGRDDGQ